MAKSDASIAQKNVSPIISLLSRPIIVKRLGLSNGVLRSDHTADHNSASRKCINTPLNTPSALEYLLQMLQNGINF